jgi:hypothetical protein
LLGPPAGDVLQRNQNLLKQNKNQNAYHRILTRLILFPRLGWACHPLGGGGVAVVG